MMLLNIMINNLKLNFPDLKFSVDEEKESILIPALHEEVGGIEIQVNYDELIVYVGRFTHWHAGCYREDFAEVEKAEAIAEGVSNFLRDTFNDQIILWGSHEKGGGFYHKDKGEEPNAKSWLGTESKQWVWSGPKNSE